MFTKKYRFSAARGAFSYFTDIIIIHTYIHTSLSHSVHSTHRWSNESQAMLQLCF